jgi:hypothetical protein
MFLGSLGTFDIGGGSDVRFPTVPPAAEPAIHV